MITVFTYFLFTLFSTGIVPVETEELLIRGKVVDGQGEPFIAATVEEFGKPINFVPTNFDGEFKIQVRKKEPLVLWITYACSSFNDFLYLVNEPVNFQRVEIYTKEADRLTRRIRRKWKRSQKKTLN